MIGERFHIHKPSFRDTLRYGCAHYAGIMTAAQGGFSAAGGGFAGDLWYVDPSASGSSETGLINNPFLSAMNAMDAKINKTLTVPIHIECSTSGSTPDTEQIESSGWGQYVPGAHYVKLYTSAGHRASGAWNTSKYHLYPAHSVTAGTAFHNTVSNIWFDGLQIGISSQPDQAEILYWGGSGGKLSNCLIRGTNSSAQLTRGISVIDAGGGLTTIKGWNNVFMRIGSNISSNSAILHGLSQWYNCTFIQSGGIQGFHVMSDGVVTAKNCYAWANGYEAYSVEGGGTMNLTTCAANDATGTAGLDSIAVNTTNFTNVTDGSDDFHLPSGSALRDTGTNVAADGAPFDYATDMDGVAHGTYSVGALEFV